MSLKEFKQTDLRCIYCGAQDVFRDETGETSASGQHYCATCGQTFRTNKQPLNAFTTARMAVMLAELKHRSEPKICAKCIYFHKHSGLWIETKSTGRLEAGVCNKHERITSPADTCLQFVAHKMLT